MLPAPQPKCLIASGGLLCASLVLFGGYRVVWGVFHRHSPWKLVWDGCVIPVLGCAPGADVGIAAVILL